MSEFYLGIDLGGTKIESILLSEGRDELFRLRVDTPNDYTAILQSVRELVQNTAEQIPESGFDPFEAYIESSSVQCETRVCMVYHYEGDPKANADSAEVDDRVYCTCRCNSADTGFSECDCPDGFSCVDVLEQGGPGVRGGYCVRNGTFTE